MGLPQAEEPAIDMPADKSSQSLPMHPNHPTGKEATHDQPAQAVIRHWPRARWNRSLCDGPLSWGYETASILFSILCFAAMVIVLANINGRLLSSWDLPVSPNAVISVLSTAFKAGMILPMAERLVEMHDFARCCHFGNLSQDRLSTGIGAATVATTATMRLQLDDCHPPPYKHRISPRTSDSVLYKKVALSGFPVRA